MQQRVGAGAPAGAAGWRDASAFPEVPDPTLAHRAALAAPARGTAPQPAPHCPPARRPEHTDYARMARWLVHLNTWATVSTIQRGSGLPSG
jgi:hypothetical protein